jgi:3-dehydroquinate synthase
MIAAARIGRALDKLTDGDRARIEGTIEAVGRLPALTGLKSKDVLEALQHDKKVRDGAVHFVLPCEIGRVEITPNVPFELVREVVQGIVNHGKRVLGTR